MVMLLTASGAYAKTIKIIAFGDSLTAGYGLPPGDAFPDKLQAALRREGLDVEIINSGVSGDTTAAGLARFDWAIPSDADGVILQLGANDALRGLTPDIPRRNLTAILDKLRQRNMPVLIAGMLSPPNWGDEYRTAFNGIYPALAKTYGAPLYPFFLEGVAMEPKLNQSDGIHPNAKGIDLIVAGILPKVKQLIANIEAASANEKPASSAAN
ncbi:MAG: arylesterase [Pseudomonadota bacterium]